MPSEPGPARRHASALPVIDPARCTGCGWCVPSCPDHLLSLDIQGGRKVSILHDVPACTGCGRCAVACPFKAWRMEKIPTSADEASTRRPQDTPDGPPRQIGAR